MSTGKVEKKGWTDAEKNALLVALIASAGPPDWNKVMLPAGRSKQACYHQYAAALKSADGVDMGGPPAVIKKRASRKNPNTNGATKRKRGPKLKEELADDVSEEEAGVASKKAKQERPKIKEEAGEHSGSEGKEDEGENDREYDEDNDTKIGTMINKTYEEHEDGEGEKI